MFIECGNCRATYKIDEEKIPKQKSFVKCTKCQEAISLPTGEDSNNDAPSRIEVACDNCGACYAVPQDKFSDSDLKVRCGKCGNQFQASKDASHIAAPKFPTKVMPASEIEETPQVDEEFKVDGLFDDINQPEPPPQSPSTKPQEQPRTKPRKLTPEEEYLESVNLSKQQEDDEDMEIGVGTIPVEQKYKFFLMPNENPKSGVNPEPREAGKEGGRMSELLEKELRREFSSTTGTVEEIEERLEDGQEKTGILSPSIETVYESESRKLKQLWAGLIFVLLIAAIVLLLFVMTRHREERKAELQSALAAQSESRVVITKKTGFSLTNKNYKPPIYVIAGILKNLNPTDVRVGSVVMKGILYDDEKRPYKENLSYAGNIIETGNLRTWKKLKINNFLGRRTGRTESRNSDLKRGADLPFQIVFFDVLKKIGSFEVTVSQFSREGKTASFGDR